MGLVERIEKAAQNAEEQGETTALLWKIDDGDATASDIKLIVTLMKGDEKTSIVEIRGTRWRVFQMGSEKAGTSFVAIKKLRKLTKQCKNKFLQDDGFCTMCGTVHPKGTTKLRKRSLEEIVHWWKTNNPHMRGET